jgi:hypothetical protein
MDIEYEALEKNRTWHLVSRSNARNVIDSKWVYKVKKNVDGTLDRYKSTISCEEVQAKVWT